VKRTILLIAASWDSIRGLSITPGSKPGWSHLFLYSTILFVCVSVSIDIISVLYIMDVFRKVVILFDFGNDPETGW
jgi:hypothetical protein